MLDSHRLSRKQRDEFLEANGLVVQDDHLWTPANDKVGAITQIEETYVLYMFVEQYTLQGIVVKAWWPGFRPAWCINIIGDQDGKTTGPILGPGDVICDLCQAPVRIRPVPVLNEHALCQECFMDTNLRFPGKVDPYVPKRHVEGEQC